MVNYKMSKYKPFSLPDCPFYGYSFSEDKSKSLYCSNCSKKVRILFKDKYGSDMCMSCCDKLYVLEE